MVQREIDNKNLPKKSGISINDKLINTKKYLNTSELLSFDDCTKLLKTYPDFAHNIITLYYIYKLISIAS